MITNNNSSREAPKDTPEQKPPGRKQEGPFSPDFSPEPLEKGRQPRRRDEPLPSKPRPSKGDNPLPNEEPPRKT